MSDNKLLENKDRNLTARYTDVSSKDFRNRIFNVITMIYFSQLSISMEYYNLKDFSHSYVHRHDRNVFIV